MSETHIHIHTAADDGPTPEDALVWQHHTLIENMDERITENARDVDILAADSANRDEQIAAIDSRIDAIESAETTRQQQIEALDAALTVIEQARQAMDERLVALKSESDAAGERLVMQARDIAAMLLSGANRDEQIETLQQQIADLTSMCDGPQAMTLTMWRQQAAQAKRGGYTSTCAGQVCGTTCPYRDDVAGADR